jgi:hypothetical protein
VSSGVAGSVVFAPAAPAASIFTPSLEARATFWPLRVCASRAPLNTRTPVAPLSATWMLPAVSLLAVVRTVGVEMVVRPLLAADAVWKLASPDWMDSDTRCWRETGFCVLSSIVIRLSGLTVNTVPSAKRISAAPFEPVRTRSFCRSSIDLAAGAHSSVPARFTCTLPSKELNWAPVSTRLTGVGAGAGGRRSRV